MIGETIRNRRRELGWSQGELAEKMGYKSKSTINKIEQGKNDVTQSRIRQFSEVLGISVAQLMGWKEYSTPQDLVDVCEGLDRAQIDRVIAYAQGLKDSKE